VSSDGSAALFLHRADGSRVSGAPGAVRLSGLGGAAGCGCADASGSVRPNELEAVSVRDAFGSESLTGEAGGEPRTWRHEVWAAMYAPERPCVARIAVLPGAEAWPVVGWVTPDGESQAAAESRLRDTASGSNLNALALLPAGWAGPEAAAAVVVTGKMWRGFYSFPASAMLPE